MRLRFAAFMLALFLPASGLAQVAPAVAIWTPASVSQVQGISGSSLRITNALISRVARIVCSVNCWYGINVSGNTAAVTKTTGVYLPANTQEYIIVPLNSTISVIADTTNGFFVVTPMTK